MYKTTVTPDKGKPFEAEIDYTIWSEVFTCPHCGGEVVFYDAAFDSTTGNVRETSPARQCGARVDEEPPASVRTVKVRTLRWRFHRARRVSGPCASPGESEADRAEAVDEPIGRCWRRIAALSCSGFPSSRLAARCTWSTAQRLGPKGFTAGPPSLAGSCARRLAVLWSWAERGARPRHAARAAVLDRAGLLGSVLDEPVQGRRGSRRSIASI